jgi:hypothetical protein
MRIALSLLLASWLAVPQVTLPGPRPARSPNGRYDVLGVERSAWPDPHRLLLKDRASGSASEIYTFDRCVDVLWAADSRHFAVTDWAGSAESLVVVFETGPPVHSAQILIPPSIERDLERAASHHVYVTVEKWLSNERLLLEVYGYGSRPGEIVQRRFVHSLVPARERR